MSIQVFDLKRISIHAPHTRGDDFAQLFYVIGSQFQSTPLIRGATCLCSASSLVLLHISIHAPHTRGDLHWHRRITAFDIFQSTPLIRGATGPSWLTSHWESDFNPRPSYEGRRVISVYLLIAREISIHAPHTRGDLRAHHLSVVVDISIHAPHTRGDPAPSTASS